MDQEKKAVRPRRDLEADALAALEEARMMSLGPERTEAMKKAGLTRARACEIALSTHRLRQQRFAIEHTPRSRTSCQTRQSRRYSAQAIITLRFA
jgi:hypothetical protein